MKFKLFKESFKILKKKFFQLFIIEFLFILINLIFFVLIKNKVLNYLQIIQNETSIPSLDNVVTSAMMFAFIIVPITFILIWVIFQSLLWKSIKQNINRNKNYFINLAIISFILIALFFVLIYRFIGTGISDYMDTSTILIILIVFIFYYLITVCYLALRGEEFIKDLKIFLQTAIKKFFRLFPYTLLAFIVSLSLFFLFLILLTSYLINDFFFLPPLLLVFYLLIVIILNLWVKIILNIRFSETK